MDYTGKWVKCLIRRKQVDSVHHNSSSTSGQPQLAKALSVPHITAIGIGTTIGAGVYILIGTVARENTGPALTLSFLFAGIAAALSAFCYAELASRCPSAGSAYHYSYVCVGEGVAWLIGWALMLEYTIGELQSPWHISKSAILIIIVTMLLCFGIKESVFAQAVVTSGNVCAMLFIIIAGGYLGFKTGWAGYELPKGYFPFGINGVLSGSATVFFSYIGFDAVASAAEEVKNPKRDLPLGIAFSLLICCALYMLVSVVVVGLIPYYELDPDTPISSAFSSQGMQWAAYIITIGASTALFASLLGSFLPQPRVLMAMARDGLLPSFFSDINPHTQVPVKGTIITGAFAAILALFMDVSQLAGMKIRNQERREKSKRIKSQIIRCKKYGGVIDNTPELDPSSSFKLLVSVGTLLSFTIVAISILIVRYVPPDEVPLPSSLLESTCVASWDYSAIVGEVDEADTEKHVGTSNNAIQPLLHHGNLSAGHPLILKQSAECSSISHDEKRRKIAGWAILLTCLGAFLLTIAASHVGLTSIPCFTLFVVGAALLISSLIVLSCINQDEARHSFGHTGGFICPLIPLLPIASILINMYLLVNLGAATWVRVLVWMTIGVLIYALYGRTRSELRDAVYVPAARADKIFRGLCSHT